MEFREARKEDLDFVANHSISRGKPNADCIDYVYTLEHEGEPIAVGGFKLMNYDTAWCWINLTYISKSHIIIVYRVIKEWIDIFVKEHNLTRLQATVECDFEEAIRMIEHLGFERESIMKKYVEGRDAYMYVRLRGD